MRKFLIWSEEHGAWWAPDRWGYTHSIIKAGRYTAEQAINICAHANVGGFNEIAIPVPEGVPERVDESKVGRHG